MARSEAAEGYAEPAFEDEPLPRRHVRVFYGNHDGAPAPDPHVAMLMEEVAARVEALEARIEALEARMEDRHADVDATDDD
jgi:uncharacterized protein YceH (UPF0502 family)